MTYRGDVETSDAMMAEYAADERRLLEERWARLLAMPSRERRLWMRKDGTGKPERLLGTVLGVAGSFSRLLAEWEPVMPCGKGVVSSCVGEPSSYACPLTPGHEGPHRWMP